MANEDEPYSIGTAVAAAGGLGDILVDRDDSEVLTFTLEGKFRPNARFSTTITDISRSQHNSSLVLIFSNNKRTSEGCRPHQFRGAY